MLSFHICTYVCHQQRHIHHNHQHRSTFFSQLGRSITPPTSLPNTHPSLPGYSRVFIALISLVYSSSAFRSVQRFFQFLSIFCTSSSSPLEKIKEGKRRKIPVFVFFYFQFIKKTFKKNKDYVHTYSKYDDWQE